MNLIIDSPNYDNQKYTNVELGQVLTVNFNNPYEIRVTGIGIIKAPFQIGVELVLSKLKVEQD